MRNYGGDKTSVLTMMFATLLFATSVGAQTNPITGALTILLFDDEPAYLEVTSNTGRIWLDRNLGASRVAISRSDTSALGDLYQWGRLTDGHEKRTSSITSTLSTLDNPGHGEFITANSPFDWRSPQNPSLWQGLNGVNNPCPDGFRLPTDFELQQEKNSWPAANADGAFASPLKWVMAGYRNHYLGGVEDVGVLGSYWSSTTVLFSAWPDIYRSRNLDFGSTIASLHTNVNAAGRSVRCVKAPVMLP